MNPDPIVSLPAALALLALGLNGFTFFAFWLDKRRAIAGEWRVPEATLLFLSLCGGWIGAKLAQRICRHKTRKQPFRWQLNGIVLVWLVGVPVLVWQERGGALSPVVETWLARGLELTATLHPGALPTATPEAASPGPDPAAQDPAPRRMPHRFGPGADP